jgi:hypothetical protein
LRFGFDLLTILNNILIMKENVLKFKNDIKALVAKQKEIGYVEEWMHPLYCAYYILKHNVEDKDAYIEEDIKNSHKALAEDYIKSLFRNKVNNVYKKYSETVCPD